MTIKKRRKKTNAVLALPDFLTGTKIPGDKLNAFLFFTR
jgi:hypothetical protein